jgi:hypothetical protein
MSFRMKSIKPGREGPGAHTGLSRFDNRRVFISVMVTGILMIALAAGFSIYRLAFNKLVEMPSPKFDLTSLRISGTQPPAQPQVDAANPCMVLQEHLELLRRKDYDQAYADLCSGLQSMTPLVDFTNNARLNAALFRDVQGYRFTSFQSSGTAASVDGYMVYNGGGKSRVQAQFSRQPDGWKIALMTVIYQ